jgi:hypothetical protein
MLNLLVLCAAITTAPAMNKPDTTRVQVMVLGTYHMDNPGLDYVKTIVDDHLSAKRQAEIIDLVDRLSRFKPDKIAIESVYGTTTFNDRLAKFAKGEYKLTADERDQIGMRLARKLGHTQLWPVDYKQDMDIESVMKVAERDHDQESLKLFGEAMQTVQKLATERAKKSVREVLLEENDPKWQRQYQSLYVRMASVGNAEDYTGADVLAGWYQRNIKIFANLRRSIKSGDRRVLLIIGSGHAPILRQLIEDSLELELVEPSKYLRD